MVRRMTTNRNADGVQGLNARTVKVGMRVRGRDATGGQEGTVVRVLGRMGVGGGVHARVRWDSGSPGGMVHRVDTLVAVKP